VKKFQNNLSATYGLDKQISPEAMDCFVNYDWPGNIRELENIIERTLVTSSSSVITPEDLPDYLLKVRIFQALCLSKRQS